MAEMTGHVWLVRRCDYVNTPVRVLPDMEAAKAWMTADAKTELSWAEWSQDRFSAYLAGSCRLYLYMADRLPFGDDDDDSTAS